jgi:hypothetical protein
VLAGRDSDGQAFLDAGEPYTQTQHVDEDLLARLKTVAQLHCLLALDHATLTPTLSMLFRRKYVYVTGLTSN